MIVEYLMNRLSLTANSSRSWHTNLKTIANRLLASLALLLAFFTLTGASSFFVQDNAHLINTDTKQIVEKKKRQVPKDDGTPHYHR